MGWVNKASLTLPLFTEVPVPSQESEQSCACVLVGIDFASFYDFSIGFWNCSDSGIFCFSFYFSTILQLLVLYIMVVISIDGRNNSTLRKPCADCPQVTVKFNHQFLHSI